MIQVAYLDSGVQGTAHYYQSRPQMNYNPIPVHSTQLDLSPYDTLVIPNGSDQEAIKRHQATLLAFLQTGKTILCFDGWYQANLPANNWIYDCSKPTREIRYHMVQDNLDLMDGVDLDALQYMHGISGWWACGYIEPAPGAEIVLADTWNRPVAVLDRVSTPGQIFMTASGPLGDVPDGEHLSSLTRFYRNLLAKLALPQAAATTSGTPR